MTEETDDLDKRLSVHEAVCAERYQAIIARIGRLEKVILAVAGALIVGMGGLLVKVLGAVAKVGAA